MYGPDCRQVQEPELGMVEGSERDHSRPTEEQMTRSDFDCEEPMSSPPVLYHHPHPPAASALPSPCLCLFSPSQHHRLHHRRRRHQIQHPSSSSPSSLSTPSTSLPAVEGTNCPASDREGGRPRKRSSPCHYAGVARAGVLLLVLMSCLGVNVARPSSSSSSSSLSSSRHEQRYREAQSRAVKYLAQFGYLTGPSRETGNLMSADDLTRAIKSLQAMGGLPQTGKVDRRTEELMSKPRCGNVDTTMGVIPGYGRSDLGHDRWPEGRRRKRRRYKRYTEAPTKWGKKKLTFRLLNYARDWDQNEVRRTILDAFKLWSAATQLQFIEVAQGEADIMIQFASRYHQDGYPFDGKGMILAHAFFPGVGKGGDTHFDNDEMWTLNSTDGVDLFMVAAHEFGHALGLAHSADPRALMYPWYQGFSGKFVLPRDDTQGIQKLYGFPHGDREFPVGATIPTIPRVDNTDNVTPRHRGSYDISPDGDDEGPPDPCTTPFDAITIIRNVVFLFIGKWFWRLDSKNVAGDPVQIHKFWYGLPKEVTKIDAVFENPVDKKIIFFSGNRYWLYNANRLVTGFKKEGEPITDFGIPADVTHIDTVFTWGFNKRTYLVSGDMYWKLFENNTHVEFDYPRDMSIWRGVKVPLDAAFKYWDGKTYFFKGNVYWKFYDLKMRVEKAFPRSITKDWLQCSDPHTQIRNNPAQHRRDEGLESSTANHHYSFTICLGLFLFGKLTSQWLQI